MLKRCLPSLIPFIVRPFSFLLVLFAYALILGVSFWTCRIIIPLSFPFETKPILNLFHYCIVIFGLFNIMFNYTACTFTSPGSPPDGVQSAELLIKEEIYLSNKSSKPQRRYVYKHEIVPGASYRYCRICRCIKPPRAHHCSISMKCVLNYDHYCPVHYSIIQYTVQYIQYPLFIINIY